MKRTLELINQMQADGVIGQYAIGGAVGARRSNASIWKALMSKHEMREQLAALSFSEKIKILEKLRDRSLVLAACGLRKMKDRGRNAFAPKSKIEAKEKV